LLFNGDEAIISLFIAFCKLQAYDGFIIRFILNDIEGTEPVS